MSSGSDSVPARLRPLPGHAERRPPGEQPVEREDASEERRRRILAATIELVAKRGYHGTTLELIVRRAKVGYPAFYKYFDGKEAAFLAVIDEGAKYATAAAADALAEHPERPWPERVAIVLDALFTVIAEHPLLARACLVEVLTAGPVVVGRYEQALRGAAGDLRHGRTLNPRAAELADGLEETLAGGVAWIAYQRLVAGDADRVPALLPEALEFVLLPYLGEAETARAIAECL
jgi:AcrR family transcriptional regulator